MNISQTLLSKPAIFALGGFMTATVLGTTGVFAYNAINTPTTDKSSVVVVASSSSESSSTISSSSSSEVVSSSSSSSESSAKKASTKSSSSATVSSISVKSMKKTVEAELKNARFYHGTGNNSDYWDSRELRGRLRLDHIYSVHYIVDNDNWKVSKFLGDDKVASESSYMTHQEVIDWLGTLPKII